MCLDSLSRLWKVGKKKKKKLSRLDSMGEPRLVGGGHINRMVGDPPSSYVVDAPYLELRVLTDDQSYLGELLDPSNKSTFWVEIQEKYKNYFFHCFYIFTILTSQFSLSKDDV